MTLDDSLLAIKGVGPELAHKFAKLGLQTIGDLAGNIPRRYDDFSNLSPISRLRPGSVSFEARIKQVTGRYVRRGMHITEAIAEDDSGSTRLVWFNQPYRANSIKAGERYFVSGVYELRRQRFAVANPSIELVSDFPINTARIVPVYRETKGLTSRQIRAAIRQIVPLIRRLPETLPAWVVGGRKLASRAEALEAVHFPQTTRALEQAKKRLGFEEVFELSLASLLNKCELAHDHALPVEFREELARKFVQNLPFKLTGAQRKVVWRIYQDMQQPRPMNRLVEGDVGSGKTVVAAMGSLMALAEGRQVALMAPTELLARQHAETIHALLRPLGLHHKVALLIGGQKPQEKDKVLAAIARGRAQFVIGTHALIQERVDMQRLALAIIDEQHRFGVEQRKKLMAKAGHMPHLLSLTATPIPRSLALTLYGELDVSVLDAKPPGRQPVVTEICSPNSRAQLYDRIAAELDNGRQMFVVCPLITQADGSRAMSAETVFKQLQTRDLAGRRIGLLHGKMKAADKQDIMQQFASGQLDVLVSTTVIEVGVDVPNASIMLIEAAERFGLAQIHQLRGRVGRGGHKGYCFLMISDSAAPPQRLRALESESDGFKLAELDLSLRGPGAIYGTMQHGALDLRVARLDDIKLIAAARESAQILIDKEEDLLQYPELAERVRRLRAVTNLN
ncbi:MAG: ATP-dependent DNA helicase RecG [Candidatus Saccharimonadales bacterium]